MGEVRRAVLAATENQVTGENAGRIAVPAKMTSSMPAPRIDLGEDSPITQRIASSTLDLPQPLGPTMPVRPGSTISSAGSTKLLKPDNLRRLTFTLAPIVPRRSSSAAQHRLERRPFLAADQAAAVWELALAEGAGDVSMPEPKQDPAATKDDGPAATAVGELFSNGPIEICVTRIDGETIDPSVSVPMPNAHRPAATHAADPALEPEAPSIASWLLALRPRRLRTSTRWIGLEDRLLRPLVRAGGRQRLGQVDHHAGLPGRRHGRRG